jgi:DnaJ-class molecular chaperone
MAGQGNEQVYADIVNAYELLKDKERRRQYDLTGSTGNCEVM